MSRGAPDDGFQRVHLEQRIQRLTDTGPAVQQIYATLQHLDQHGANADDLNRIADQLTVIQAAKRQIEEAFWLAVAQYLAVKQ